MDLHIENRNKILFKLKHVFIELSSDRLYESVVSAGNFTNNLSKTNEKFCSPIIKEFLIEMDTKRFDDSNNMDCYRCKHFLNIPQHSFETYEKISDSSEEYVTDLNFVQTIVWLKSVTMFMKDISIEQFHLMFHKQWKNENDYRDLSLIDPVSDNREGDMNFNNDSECTSNIQSPERFFNTKAGMEEDTTLNNHIIRDSDEYSSDSDMFRDDSENQEASSSIKNEQSYKLFKENDLSAKRSAETFSLHSRNSIISKDIFMETEDENDDLSNITFFDEDYLLSKQNHIQLTLGSNKQIVIPSSNSYNSNFQSKDSIISSDQVNNVSSCQKDSAYDTHQLSVEDSLPIKNNCIHQIQDPSISSSQEVDKITSDQKDMCSLQFLTTDTIEKDWISGQNEQLYSGFSQQKNKKNENLSKIEYNNGNKYSQTYKDLIEDTECDEKSSQKKRKLKIGHESGIMSRINKKRKISSQWLKFTLDSLNVDEVAFQSVKVILSVIQNDKVTRHYMKNRCWKDTLEEQAINAILNFRDVFEAGNKTNACTQEIVQMAISLLDKNLRNTELNKVTILTHQISIILQLCNSMQVCIEMINYLTATLKSYENTLIILTDKKKANVHDVINQLHVIFYALSFCLKKYQLVFRNRGVNQSEEIIPPVIDSWKKQFCFKNVILEDNIKTRERQWLMILDNFAVIATENFVQFAKKSRKLFKLLT